jgi:hypothetical protein
MPSLYIDREECIGDSLVKLNSNFSGLDTDVLGLVNLTGILASNIRISLDPSTPVVTSDIKNATVLYVHPYKGNTVSIYNTQLSKWLTYTLNAPIAASLSTLTADITYDVFLGYVNGNFSVTFDPWPVNNIGSQPPARTYVNGIAVKSNDASRRLIGCIRATATGQSEQSFGGVAAGGTSPKQFVWNAQNRLPVAVRSFDNGAWSVQSPAGPPYNTGWLRVNSTGPGFGNNNRFTFITGEQTVVDVSSSIHFQMTRTDMAAYQILSVNNDVTPNYVGYGIISSENAGLANSGTYSELKHAFNGYNFIQMFELYYTSGFSQPIGDTGHGNLQMTGLIASLEN